MNEMPQIYNSLKSDYTDANLNLTTDLILLITQINKDLNQSGYDVAIKIESDFKELIDTLHYYIHIFIDANSSDLRGFLYRVDVSEKELLTPELLTPLKIVELIIKREILKIKFRKLYS